MANVLVVDDEPDILLLHRLNLEAAGHTVVLAADGMTALDRIAESNPDCVVLDVMMPVLDGWGVLERLRAVEGSPPVLVGITVNRAVRVCFPLPLTVSVYRSGLDASGKASAPSSCIASSRTPASGRVNGWSPGRVQSSAKVASNVATASSAVAVYAACVMNTSGSGGAASGPS